MIQLFLALQSVIGAIAAGIVGLDVIPTEIAAVIVFVCTVINSGITAYLSSAAGQKTLRRE